MNSGRRPRGCFWCISTFLRSLCFGTVIAFLFGGSPVAFGLAFMYRWLCESERFEREQDV